MDVWNSEFGMEISPEVSGEQMDQRGAVVHFDKGNDGQEDKESSSLVRTGWA